MKFKSNAEIIYYVCAVVFYALAAMNFSSEETRTMAVIWLCVGSSLLFLGQYKKKKK